MKFKKLISPLFIVFFLLISTNAGYCIFGLPSLKMFNKTKAQLIDRVEKVENEMGVVKDNQVKLESKIMAKIEAKIVGLDNSLKNELQAGRDAISTTNDTGLMKWTEAILAGALAQAYLIILYLLASQRLNNRAKNKLIEKLATKEKEIDHIKKNGNEK